MGWFGFNGGSQLAMGSVGDVADISRIFSNTNAAAAGGGAGRARRQQRAPLHTRAALFEGGRGHRAHVGDLRGGGAGRAMR